MLYSAAGDYAVNFEPHGGYTQLNTREVMKGLLVWTSDGMRCCMTIISVRRKQYLFVWTIFGRSKWPQFVVDCLCDYGVIECGLYLMD